MMTITSSEIFNLDTNFKDSKRLSMHGMEKELTDGLQTNFKKTSKMANLKYLIVVQHPRQYALEGSCGFRLFVSSFLKNFE